MRKYLAMAAVAGLMLVPTAASAGVTGPAFYVDGELYRTVGTPTDFEGTGAPDDSYDTIYALVGHTNVAEAAPGDRDFNGGRWMVEEVAFTDHDAAIAAAEAATPGTEHDNGEFDTAEEVEAALEAGLAVSNGIVKQFECPVIHIPKPQR